MKEDNSVKLGDRERELVETYFQNRKSSIDIIAYKEDAIYKNYLNAVLDLLRKGYLASSIKKKLNITHGEFVSYLNVLIKRNWITWDIINKAREHRIEKYLEAVRAYIEKGEKISSIITEYTDLEKKELDEIVKKLLEEGKITKEQVKYSSRKKSNSDLRRWRMEQDKKDQEKRQKEVIQERIDFYRRMIEDDERE